MPPPPPLLSAGMRLAGYEVAELVGRGGMGEVYRARQLSMDRVVALKVLSPRLARQDPSFAAQFVAEARAAGKLNHANIVGVHDVGEAPAPEGAVGIDTGATVNYFSMEFIDGESVKDIIERQGTVDRDTIALVMQDMSEALAYAESVKIVHRDIKPDNILIAGKGIAKLADLGLALHTEAQDGVNERDEQGRAKVMGTPLYMSPEQARALPVDHRSDQYSLGATLFHMLAGRPPFLGENAKAIMRMHCFEPVPDPRTLNPQAPPPWADLCQRLMAKTPDERFANSSDLRAAVKGAIRWKPGHRTGTRPVRQTRRPWIAIASTTAAALGLASWAWSHSNQPPPAELVHQVQPTAATPRQRVDALLARLPQPPDEALRQLDQALADPTLAPEHPRLVMRRGELIERQDAGRRAPIRESLDRAERDLENGRFRAASTGLATVTDEPWVHDRLVRAQRQLAEMQQGLQQRLAGRIDAAKQLQELADARLACTHAELPDASRQQLLDQADAAAKRLAQPAAAPAPAPIAPAALPAPPAWRAIGEQLDAARAQLPYQGFQQACDKAASSLPEADRPLLATLAGISKLATDAESAIRQFIGLARPRVEARLGKRTGTFLIVGLDKDAVTFRLPDAPAESRVDRSTAQLPWTTLLSGALAPKPDPSVVAAFLWYWRSPDADAAVARIADQPLGQAIIRLQRLTRPWSVAGRIERVSQGYSIGYPFAAAKDPELASAWQGADLVLGNGGLRWSCRTVVGEKNRSENDLPTLRWKSSLVPPAEMTAVLKPAGNCLVALAGFACGDRLVRIALNHTKRAFFIVASEADGNYAIYGKSDNEAYNALEPVTVSIAVDTNGQVTFTGNQTGIVSKEALRFPAGVQVVPVFQIRQVTEPTTVDLVQVTLKGRAP